MVTIQISPGFRSIVNPTFFLFLTLWLEWYPAYPIILGLRSTIWYITTITSSTHLLLVHIPIRRKVDQILAQRMFCHPPSGNKWKDNGHGGPDSHDLESNGPNASEEELSRLLSVYIVRSSPFTMSSQDLVPSWDLGLKENDEQLTLRGLSDGSCECTRTPSQEPTKTPQSTCHGCTSHEMIRWPSRFEFQSLDTKFLSQRPGAS